ncbi:MAG TPA: pilus assembly protein CpaE [Pilimelia sp.]|nr:pilus assembly protein CpaE [Pilimelia sp.]
MISLDLARRLHDAGLVWKPTAGDRFTIPDRDLDDDVFVLSDMTIEVHQLADGPVIGFNGTTEWALDDVGQDEALWLPREDQLRDLLRTTFRSLSRTPAGYRVEVEILGESAVTDAVEPADAYAQALLVLLRAAGANDAAAPPPGH